MYPLVESVDLFIFHPVHAVTAHDKLGFTKRKSVIQLGDVLFCKPQPHGLYYAHLVLEIEALTHGPVKFTIGDIKGHKNGQCFEDHIFGIAVAILMNHEAHQFERPLPQQVLPAVQQLVVQGTTLCLQEAESLCRPRSVQESRPSDTGSAGRRKSSRSTRAGSCNSP